MDDVGVIPVSPSYHSPKALTFSFAQVILKPYKLDALLEKIRAFRSFEL